MCNLCLIRCVIKSSKSCQVLYVFPSLLSPVSTKWSAASARHAIDFAFRFKVVFIIMVALFGMPICACEKNETCLDILRIEYVCAFHLHVLLCLQIVS